MVFDMVLQITLHPKPLTTPLTLILPDPLVNSVYVNFQVVPSREDPVTYPTLVLV